jgi:hypothetical protein
MVRQSLSSEGAGAMTNTVGDDFPKQQTRVRRIQQHAREIGPSGTFLVVMCERALQEAEQAAVSGDPVRILRAYQELVGFQE